MHLQGQAVVRRDELDEERIAAEPHGVFVAEDGAAVFLEELVEGPALVGPVGDHADVAFAVGELPGLPDAAAGALLAEDLGQLRPAPDLGPPQIFSL